MRDKYHIVSFYSFVRIEKNLIELIKINLLEFEKKELTGLVVLGNEGINGTVCAPRYLINDFINLIRLLLDLTDLNIKESYSEKRIFKKLKVKIKGEIVTMGISDVSPNLRKGTYVDSSDWNNLLEDRNTLVIDTRNNYEINLGTFKNAINPNTKKFREFPKWVDTQLDEYLKNKEIKNIAMFCTGGIRCEKATSLLKSKGYKNVFHLKGGILKYLEEVPSAKSLYEGECYVFDDRVALDQNLKKGSYSICHACGMPLSEDDKIRDEYIEGIQCHLCINKFSDQDRKRFAERQKQIDKERKIKNKD